MAAAWFTEAAERNRKSYPESHRIPPSQESPRLPLECLYNIIEKSANVLEDAFEELGDNLGIAAVWHRDDLVKKRVLLAQELAHMKNMRLVCKAFANEAAKHLFARIVIKFTSKDGFDLDGLEHRRPWKQPVFTFRSLWGNQDWHIGSNMVVRCGKAVLCSPESPCYPQIWTDIQENDALRHPFFTLSFLARLKTLRIYRSAGSDGRPEAYKIHTDRHGSPHIDIFSNLFVECWPLFDHLEALHIDATLFGDLMERFPMMNVKPQDVLPSLTMLRISGDRCFTYWEKELAIGPMGGDSLFGEQINKRAQIQGILAFVTVHIRMNLHTVVLDRYKPKTGPQYSTIKTGFYNADDPSHAEKLHGDALLALGTRYSPLCIWANDQDFMEQSSQFFDLMGWETLQGSSEPDSSHIFAAYHVPPLLSWVLIMMMVEDGDNDRVYFGMEDQGVGQT